MKTTLYFCCLLVLIIILSSKSSYSQDTVTSEVNTFIVTAEYLRIIDINKGEERTIPSQGCTSIRRYNDGTEEDPKDWHLALYFRVPETDDYTSEDVMFARGEKEACEKLQNSLMRLWKL